MEIRQEVSDISDSSIPVAAGVTAPIFFRRVAETTVTVKDTETVVLGGLIQTRDSRSETKVPILGDLPGLGALFRTQNEESRRTELLIILTPRVIRTVEDYHDVSVFERDNMHSMPPEILSNPLMNTLQVQPDQPLPTEPRRGPPPAEQRDALPPKDARDEYGPSRPGNAPRIEPGTDPNSYDVPITRRNRQ
jgi:general secretion pathway protein D